MSPKPATAEQVDATPEAEPNVLASQLEIVSKALVQIDAVSAGIAELRAKYQGVLFDVTTTKGMKEACEARAEIREPRYDVEKLRKAAKRPILDLGKKLDTEAERITHELLAIEAPIDAQITAEQTRKENEKKAREAAEAARIAAIHERIENDIRQAAFAATNRSSADIEVLIKDVVAIEINDSFAEFKQQAEGAKATTLIRLRAALANAQAIEAEQKRLAVERGRLAEQERVAKVAREAEERRQTEARELAEARLGEIQGIQHQVFIASTGRLGVRKGGTRECIVETLLETEAWEVTEEKFGPILPMAREAKISAISQITGLRDRLDALVAETARAAAQSQRQKEESDRLAAERAEADRVEAERRAAADAEQLRIDERLAAAEAHERRLSEAQAQLDREQEALRLEREKPTADVVPLPLTLTVGDELPEVSVTVGGESIPSILETTDEAEPLLMTIRLTELLPMQSVCKFAKEWAVFQQRDSKLEQKTDRALAKQARVAEANLLAVVEQLP